MTQEPRLGRMSAGTAIAVGVITAILLYRVRDALLPFVLAGIPAYLFAPLLERLAARTGAPRWVFALAMWAVLATAGSLVGYFSVRAFTEEWERIGTDLEGSLARFVHDLLGGRPLPFPGGRADSAQIAA